MDRACVCLKSVLCIGVDKDHRTSNWVLILYQTCTTIEGKINFNDAKYCGTNVMSRINAPIHSYKNDLINLDLYYQNGYKIFGNFLKHFSMMNGASYDDLKLILGSSNFNYSHTN